jgi:hypothetical protein
MHNVDEVLGDVGLDVPAAVRAWHWLAPIDPAAYRRITPALIRRQSAGSVERPVEQGAPAARA